MYKKFVSVLYVINIVAQAIFTLLTPVALMLLVGWLLVDKCGLPRWVYVPFILVGVIAGFISMIRFAIAAGEGLERLEKQNNENNKNGDNNE